MPYKSEKIQIEGTKLDRRIKLTPEQKDKIASLKGTISVRECARMYEVIGNIHENTNLLENE